MAIRLECSQSVFRRPPRSVLNTTRRWSIGLAPTRTTRLGSLSSKGMPPRSLFRILLLDLVFTRYMLIHVPDPACVLREMFRVSRPGGFVVACEPDGCIEFCYPPNAAMERMSYLWRHLFPHPLIGRQLVHFFRAAGATNYSAGAVLGMDHEQGLYKRWYRMTAEAVRPAAISMN